MGKFRRSEERFAANQTIQVLLFQGRRWDGLHFERGKNALKYSEARLWDGGEYQKLDELVAMKNRLVQ